MNDHLNKFDEIEYESIFNKVLTNCQGWNMVSLKL